MSNNDRNKVLFNLCLSYLIYLKNNLRGRFIFLHANNSCEENRFLEIFVDYNIYNDYLYFILLFKNIPRNILFL